MMIYGAVPMLRLCKPVLRVNMKKVTNTKRQKGESKKTVIFVLKLMND